MRRTSPVEAWTLTPKEADMSTAVDTSMKEFAGIFYREGALDKKTMQLGAMAAMGAAGCTS